MNKSNIFKFIIAAWLIILISACSDETSPIASSDSSGSSSGASSLGTTDASSASLTSLTLSIVLRDGASATDNEITTISASKSGFLTVSVVGSDGKAVENQIVKLSNTLSTISPDTVLTNSSGQATTTISFLTSTGADTITATAILEADTTTYTASKNYSVASPSIQLGDNSGASFLPNQLQFSSTTLSAGGNASVSVSVLDENENPFTSPLSIDFSSTCSSLSTPLATIDATVSTSSGVAVASYLAQGCVGTDVITATTTFGGTTFTATGNLTIASDQVGSIKFVSATPNIITLSGAGGAGLQETSEIRFQVIGSSGQPLQGQTVTFSVNGNAGGLTFDPVTAISNSTGEVFTTVKSGSIPLVVNVIASVTSVTPAITTQSTGLVISAGLPDDDSFTIGADKFNPEALNYNGEVVSVTVHLADVYNNPPPVGTAVFFTTEGGSIGSTCSTDATGACSVQWLSANPRPADNRVTILAYTQGVESFTDQNGDGRLSDGEAITNQLAEVFRDDNENSSYDSGEFFVDFNNNGSRDIADPNYNGNLCNDTTGRCSTQTSLNISRSVALTLSSSFANISAVENGGPVLADQTTDNQNTLDISAGQKTVTVTYSDSNGQPLPKDTTIDVTSSTGTIIGTTSVTQVDTNVAGNRSFSFTLKKTAVATGIVTITVKTPKNNETVITFNVNA